MNFRTLLAALAIATMPFAASALTLKVGATTIVDNGAGDSNPNAGEITYFGGGARITSTLFTDANGLSKLELNVSEARAGASDLKIDASHAGFGAGEGSPTTAVFAMNASQISGTGKLLSGSAYVDDGNTEFATTTLVKSGSVSNTSDDIEGTKSVTLGDPFSMSIFTTIKAGTTASYDATLTAQIVPVPAGILLMGTALAGLGVMRRRKKAA